MRIHSAFHVWLTPLLVTLLAAGCGPGAHSESDPPDDPAGETLSITTTTGMIGDLVANIAGPRAQVHMLMGPGIDPHLYKPTTGDLAALRAADIVFYNGLHLEAKLAEILHKLGETGTFIAVADGIDPDSLRSPPEFKGAHDPHVWFDVSLWIQCGRLVAQTLKDFDPDHADEYQQRADTYLAELEALDRRTREALATLPPASRVLITAHDAFGYYGHAYDLEVMGIQGLSTESEAGVRRVNELVDLLVTRGIKAVFIESSVSDKNIMALVEGARSRGHEVVIGGELYSDAMAPTGEPKDAPADHYIGMVDHNTRTIVNALR